MLDAHNGRTIASAPALSDQSIVWRVSCVGRVGSRVTSPALTPWRLYVGIVIPAPRCEGAFEVA